MDRRKYILKRLEKELRSLGYEEPCLCRYTESCIAAIFPMNENSEDLYPVQMSWIADDENDRILFRAERVLDEVAGEEEYNILHFCNEWNRKHLYGTALYDKENGGLHLDHTLPLPERMDRMFLTLQVYHHLARASEEFFKEAQKKFCWVSKEKN